MDDALIGSNIFCVACLENGLRKLWPRDVEVSVEETGPKLRLLQATVTINTDDSSTYTLCLADGLQAAFDELDFFSGIQ